MTFHAKRGLSRLANLLFHSVKLKFHGKFTIAPILFTLLSEKVHGVESKTVKIMKSRRELTYVHAVKLLQRHLE